MSAVFSDAGHIFGSSMIKLAAHENGESKSILFSGDVGRTGKPILRDPTFFEQADYVLIESTYGNRIHEDGSIIEQELAEVINSTIKAGGNIIIPSFAIERAQEILYYSNLLLREERIPPLTIFMDSPMAISVTQVFRGHPELLDAPTRALIESGHSPFDFPGLTMVRSVEESRAISQFKKPCMIIAGSGMCTAGRIKYHLANNITRNQNTVLFVGYQAAGTLGRLIVEGAQEVRILGQNYPVRARIAQINGFSAHADKNELTRWFTALKSRPLRTFVVHGETEAAFSFAEHLRTKTGWDITVPAYRQDVVLT